MSIYNKEKTWKGLGSQSLVVLIMGVMELSFFSVMSRLLTKEDFGYFAVISAITVVLSGISEAGLGSAAIQKKDPSDAFISTAFSLSLVIGLSFSLLMFFTSGYLSEITISNDSLILGFQISSVMLLFLSLNSIGRAVYMRRLNFMKFGIIQALSYFISAIIGIVLAVCGYGYYAVVWSSVLNPAILFICLLYQGAFSYKLTFEKSATKEILSFGGWLTGSTILRSLNSQVDKLIMSHWLPMSSLGMYSRSSGFISSGIDKVNSIFDVVLFPILSDIQDNKSRVISSYNKCVTLIHLFSVIVTCILILGSEVIIAIFLGEEWVDVKKIFIIISLSTIFVCYGRIADCFFRSLGEVRNYFFRRLMVLFTTVFCVYIGCQYGVIGLSIAVLIGCIIDAVIRWAFLVHIIKFSVTNLLLKVSLASIVPSACFVVCWPLTTYGIIGSCMSIVVYIFLVLLVSVFTPRLLGDVFYIEIFSKYIVNIKSKLL